MNWDQIEAEWKELAGSARAHWAKLTDDDWQAINGKMEHLIGRIQERYGIARTEAEKQVAEWCGALLSVASKSGSPQESDSVPD